MRRGTGPPGTVSSASTRARLQGSQPTPKQLVRRQEKELDRLARQLIVEIRDKNTCQRCGATAANSQIQWSHIVTRAAKSIRW